MSLQASRLRCVRGERTLFADIEIEIGPGEALHVAGANGSGKTSLLRILCGLSRPAEGEVHWEGKDIHWLREIYWRNLFYLGHAPALKDDLLVHENLVTSAAMAGQSVNHREVDAALERAGIGQLSDLPARFLSQGQRRRVALARLHLTRATLWMLDEPFAALDDEASHGLRDLLATHLSMGGMLVYTTHQEMRLASGKLRQLDLGRCHTC